MTEAVQHLQSLIRKFAGSAPLGVAKSNALQPSTRIETYQGAFDHPSFDAVHIMNGSVMSVQGASDALVKYAQHLDQQNENAERIFIFTDTINSDRVLYCVFNSTESLILRIPQSQISGFLAASYLD